MSEERVSNYLRQRVLRRRSTLVLDDKIVDSFLEQPCVSNPEIEGRVQAKVRSAVIESALRKVLKNFRDVHDLPFGRFLEAVRERATISVGDLSMQIGKPSEFVERLERGDSPPTRVPASDLATIVVLFQIKISQFTRLLSASLLHGITKETYRVAARSHGGKQTSARAADVERCPTCLTQQSWLR